MPPGDEAQLIREGRMGRVAIGFTGSATYELLPGLSRMLRTELPGLELDLHGELLTPSQVAGLVDGTLDIGFLRPPVQAPEVEVHPLRREPLVVVLPRRTLWPDEAQVTLSDLAEEPFITYPSQHRSVVHDTVLDACQAAGFTPRATEVAETSTLVSFVAAGLGVALVPESVQHLRITGAAYRPLAGDSPRWSSRSPPAAPSRRPPCARCWPWRWDCSARNTRRLRSQSRLILYFS